MGIGLPQVPRAKHEWIRAQLDRTRPIIENVQLDS